MSKDSPIRVAENPRNLSQEEQKEGLVLGHLLQVLRPSTSPSADDCDHASAAFAKKMLRKRAIRELAARQTKSQHRQIAKMIPQETYQGLAELRRDRVRSAILRRPP